MNSKFKRTDLLSATLSVIVLFFSLSGRAQPVLVTSLATNLVNGTATLNGTANPLGVDTAAWFEWGYTRAYGNSTPPQSVGSGTNAAAVNAVLSGLTSGVVYHYRCVASNSFGVGRGANQLIWTPVITLNGTNPINNECNVPFVDPTTVNASLQGFAAGTTYTEVSHNLALRPDGTVVGWGNNTYGQTNVPSHATNVVSVAAGRTHSLALKGDGMVGGWGDNTYGQTNVPSHATNVTAIAAGADYSLALKADGTIVGWGYNTIGQTDVPSQATNVVAIAAGITHSLALKADGTVVGWGDNTSGKTDVPNQATNVVAIVASTYHSMILKADGTVVAWGNNRLGQTDVPIDLANVVAIAAGQYYSLALKADGTVVCWGEYYPPPASVTNVVAIRSGGFYNLALRADGMVISWGDGDPIPASVYELDLPITVTGTVADNPGTYVLNYAATNLLGAVATATRTVNVTDTLPPVLALLGGNPLMHVIGTSFVDPGATATDLCAGDRTANVIVSGTVNTNVAGSNSLVYTVSDSSGNAAVTERIVVVVTRPVLTDLAQPGDGSFYFSFTNTSGAQFNVWSTTNLALPFSEWTLLGPVLESDSGVFQFTDFTATDHPTRFYRVE